MIIIFASAVAVAVILALLLKDQKKTENQSKALSDDFSRRRLFTESEAKFYPVLRGVLPPGFEAWGKLGLWAVVSSKTSWGKIAQKQIDFAIVKIGPLPGMVLVIELDDYTHRRKSAQKRDAEKDAILKRVGLPILRIPVASAPMTGKICEIKSSRSSVRKTRFFNARETLTIG